MDYSNRLNSSLAGLTEREQTSRAKTLREMDKITTRAREEEGTNEP